MIDSLIEQVCFAGDSSTGTMRDKQTRAATVQVTFDTFHILHSSNMPRFQLAPVRLGPSLPPPPVSLGVFAGWSPALFVLLHEFLLSERLPHQRGLGIFQGVCLFQNCPDSFVACSVWWLQFQAERQRWRCQVCTVQRWRVHLDSLPYEPIIFLKGKGKGKSLGN